MFTKIVIVACFLAVASAGMVPAALTLMSDNILRSPGNFAQISTQSKTIQTPFSSNSKSDIRVTNPSVVAHTAPVYGAYVTAPLNYGHAAPVAHSAPLNYGYAAPVAHAGLGVAYSVAPVVSHMSYSSPIGVYSY